MKGKKPSVHYKKVWARIGILMALPAILSVITFVFIPLFMNIGYSLTDYSVSSTVPRFTGLTNFRNIINDMNFKLIISNTIKLALLYVIGLNTLAIIVSVLIVRVGKKLGNFVKSVLYFPCLLAMVVVGFIWRILFNYTHGMINKALMLIGVSENAVPEWLGDPKMIIYSIGITIIWYALGYYVVIYYAGLVSIPVELYEVSNIEGANSWQEFLYVTLPLLAPSITINVVLTSMAIIGSFDLPYTLTNGGGPGKFGTTLPVWIYQTYFHDYQYGKAIAQAVLLTGVAVIIAAIELKILLKREVRT